MATYARRPQKTSRIDMRVTDDQKELIERAAALKGQSVTQWSVDCLVENARADIEYETTTRLSEAAFDAFLQELDKPLPKATRRLLSRDRVWE
jgi:uncharacterized protein (DUF1778 family)